MDGVTYTVLLSTPRAGTKMFCSALNSHPDIICEHEFSRKVPLDKRTNPSYVFEELRNNRTARAIVLHSHFEDMTEQMLNYPVILLERDAKDIVRSALLKGTKATKKEQEIKLMYKLLKPFASFCVTYESVTNNENMIKIPHRVSSNLCTFLGVPNHDLVSTFSKESK